MVRILTLYLLLFSVVTNACAIENKVAFFKGENSYINLGHEALLAPKGDFTVGVWAHSSRWIDLESKITLFANSQNCGYSVCVQKENVEAWTVYGLDKGNYSRNTDIRTFNPNLLANGWHHFAISKNDSIINFHLDGVLVSQKIMDRAIEIYYCNPKINLLLGAEPGLLGEIEKEWDFQGKMDDFKLWEQCLSPKEIFQSMNPTWGLNKPTLLIALDFNETPLKCTGKAMESGIVPSIVGNVIFPAQSVPYKTQVLGNLFLIANPVTLWVVLALIVFLIFAQIRKKKNNVSLELKLIISFMTVVLIGLFVFGENSSMLFINDDLINPVPLITLRAGVLLLFIGVIYILRYYYYPNDTQRNEFQLVKILMVVTSLFAYVGVVTAEAYADLWLLPILIYILVLVLIKFSTITLQKLPIGLLIFSIIIFGLDFITNSKFHLPVSARIPQIVILPWLGIFGFIYFTLKNVEDTPLYNNLRVHENDEEKLNSTKRILSPREYEVFHLLGGGLQDKEIAQRLYISENTVKTHLKKIYQKLNVKNRTEAVTKIA